MVNTHACLHGVLLCLGVCKYLCLWQYPQEGSPKSGCRFWRMSISHFHFWKSENRKCACALSVFVFWVQLGFRVLGVMHLMCYLGLVSTWYMVLNHPLLPVGGGSQIGMSILEVDVWIENTKVHSHFLFYNFSCCDIATSDTLGGWPLVEYCAI